MAPKTNRTKATCPMCFETRPLKIVGRCKHSFCTECVSIVFGSLEGGSEVFACPTCKVDCPLPGDGVKGLVDYFEQDASSFEAAEALPITNTRETQEEVRTNITSKCMLCIHKGNEVQAFSMCVECGHFSFCKDCTESHARNKATKNHLVTYLELINHCRKHNIDLTSHCNTCGDSVCTVCVMQDHADHDIEQLRVTITSKVKEVKDTLEEQVKYFDELQQLIKDLTLCRSIIPKVDNQETLIKEIEDHAQKCFDVIVKWKEEKKDQVRKDYKIMRDIPVVLDKVIEEVQKLQGYQDRANRLLGKTEQHSVYLSMLVQLLQDAKLLPETVDEIRQGNFKERFYELQRKDLKFVPGEIPSAIAIGEVKERGFNPKEVYEHTLRVDSADKTIPCVTILGKKFAVAHPTKAGEPSKGIDIYEFPGKLVKTLTDQVPPVYDMSSTPDEILAVLSNGTGAGSCMVKLFDPETGYLRSTTEIPMAKPLSLGVTLQQQFVILGDNDQGQRLISVCDEEGREEHRHTIGQDNGDVSDIKRVSCGGRFIFVVGEKGVVVYEIQGTGLQVIHTIHSSYFGFFQDIIATIWDDFIVAIFNPYSETYVLEKYQDRNNRLEWETSVEFSTNAPIKTNRGCMARVSTRDGHIVMTHGQTIRVYEL